LRTTIAPVASEAARAWRRRRAPDLGARDVEQPAELAGVRREERGRRALTEDVQMPDQRVEAVGVDDQRHGDGRDQLADDGLRPGAAPDPGSEDDGVRAREERLHGFERCAGERAVFLGHGPDHRFEQSRGQRQLERRRRGHGDVSGTRALGGERRHHGRARQPPGAADHDDVARSELRRSRAPARQGVEHSGADQADAGARGPALGNADVLDAHVARVALAGAIHRPGLARWKVTVTSARTAGPATSPVEASIPLGTSTATTGAGGR
jgi:hypothetical protein